MAEKFSYVPFSTRLPCERWAPFIPISDLRSWAAQYGVEIPADETPENICRRVETKIGPERDRAYKGLIRSAIAQDYSALDRSRGFAPESLQKQTCDLGKMMVFCHGKEHDRPGRAKTEVFTGYYSIDIDGKSNPDLVGNVSDPDVFNAVPDKSVTQITLALCPMHVYTRPDFFTPWLNKIKVGGTLVIAGFPTKFTMAEFFGGPVPRDTLVNMCPDQLNFFLEHYGLRSSQVNWTATQFFVGQIPYLIITRLK